MFEPFFWIRVLHLSTCPRLVIHDSLRETIIVALGTLYPSPGSLIFVFPSPFNTEHVLAQLANSCSGCSLVPRFRS
jgi:hypothetical protein